MVGAVVLTGLVLSLVLADRWSDDEANRRREELHSLTTLRRSFIESTLTRYGDLLANLAAHESTTPDDAESFSQFVSTQRLDWYVGVDNVAYLTDAGDGVTGRYTAPNPTRLGPGHDLTESPRRMAALRETVDSSLPTVGPVGEVSIPEGEERGGAKLIEVYQAVYEPGPVPASIEDRRDRHVGWVGVTIDLEETVAGLAVREGEIDMTVHLAATGELLGENTPGADQRIQASEQSLEVEVGMGSPMLMRTAFSPDHPAPMGGGPILRAGLIITALIGYATWLTQRHRVVLQTTAHYEHERAELMASRFYSAVVEAPVGVVVTGTDGTVVLVNDRLRTLVDAPDGDEISIFDYIHPDDMEEVKESLRSLSNGDRDRVHTERQLVRRDGTRLWCRLTASVARDADGNPAGVVAHVQDIAKERQAAEDLRSRERWFSSIVEHARDLIVLIGRDGTVKWASPWVAHIFDIEAHQLSGTSVLDAVHEADRDRVADAIRRVGSGEVIKVDYRVTDGNGEMIWMESTAANRLDDPDVAAIITVSRDVTKRHETAELLAHQATHDPLTGLYNRAEFEPRMTAAMRDVTPDDQHLCLAYVDIDQFKAVNDRLGHQAGDEVLRDVASAIRAEVRKDDVVARIGGDEIAIGLIGTEVDEAVKILERVRDRVRQAKTGDGTTSVTVSIGVAAARPDDDLVSLIHRADLALYESKRAGRDRLTVHRDGYAEAG